MPPKKKKKAEPRSRGLTAAEVVTGSASPAAAALQKAVEKDGGSTLAVYRDPLGGHWQLLASLPARLRRRADQPDPVPESGEGRVRRNARENARAATKFKAGNVRPEQLARAGGAPEE
jgi:hypothetical protein